MDNAKSKCFLSFMSSMLAACVLCAAGCASGNVMRYTGTAIQKGTGGAVETVDGIDVYRSGAPNGTYRILSIVAGDYYRGGNIGLSIASQLAAKNKLIKEAKAEGADAIIILSSQYQALGSTGTGVGTTVGGFTTVSGSSRVYGVQSGSAALVKYIDVQR